MIFRAFLALSGLAIMAAVPYYTVKSADHWFEETAVKEARAMKLAPETANSIKHAYAAHLVYTFFRDVGIGSETSELLTLRLGVVNELYEKMHRHPSQRDTVQELMKDFHNNIAGIEAAKWLETQPKSFLTTNRLRTISFLAENNILANQVEKIKVPAKAEQIRDEIDRAYYLSKPGQDRIATRVNDYFDGISQTAKNDNIQ
jgi:hypothetical protein